MTTTTLEKPKAAAAFAAATVEAKLRETLLDTVRSISILHDIELPDTVAGQYSVRVRLDSLGVVELLCEIEPIVGFELKDSLVKSGGYNSIDEAVGHLMPRLESAWQRHASKGAKK